MRGFIVFSPPVFANLACDAPLPVEFARAAAHGGVDLAAGIITAPVNVLEAATKGAIGMAGGESDAAMKTPRPAHKHRNPTNTHIHTHTHTHNKPPVDPPPPHTRTHMSSWHHKGTQQSVAATWTNVVWV